MKYFFLILSFVLIGTFINAQETKTDKILLDIYKKAGLERRLEHKDFVKKSAPETKLAEDVFVPEVIMAYENTDSGLTVTKDSILYDEEGNRLTTTRQVNFGGEWFNVQKDSSVFAEGQDVIYHQYLWVNDEWLLAASQYMEYNTAGSLMKLIGETFYPDSTRYEMHYQYNENEQMTESVYYVVVEDQLLPQIRYTITYNAAGDMTESLQQMIQMGGSEWVNYMRFRYEYDETGFGTSDTYELWLNNDWTVNSRVVYYKNSAGLVGSETSQYVNSGVLEVIDSVAYTYDDRGNMLTEVTLFREDDMWLLSDSTNYSYDASSRILTYEDYLWMETEWLKWNRETYEYNAGGKLVSYIVEKGLLENNTWENSTRVVYEYDNDGNQIKGEAFEWDGSSWGNANGEIEMEYLNYGDSYSAYLVEVKYKAVSGPVAVEDDNLNPEEYALAQNYPNPFNPETKINFSLPQSGKATLKIYDMLGRQVAELINGNMEKGTHTVEFNGGNLSSGVYVYRLQSGSFTESKKMMLLK